MSIKKDNLNFPTSRRFAPLFGTQFFGALNDNIFKTALFVMISFFGLGKNDLLPPSQMLNLGAMLFILPYFLFSALSGQLSNKFDKAKLARAVKLLEIAIMAVAAFGFYIQSAPLLLLCLFAMGTHSTLFGPLKYAILPDYLNDKELIMGNSLVESGTFIAILLGQIVGTSLAGLEPHFVGAVTLLVAAAGMASSLFMPSVPAKDPDVKIEYNIAKGTLALMRETVAEKPVFTAIIGISWFWFVGSVYTTQLPTFTQLHLGGNDNVFNLMLALFSIGIAAGSVLCAKLSHERLTLGLVTIGTTGLTVCGLLLVWLTHSNHFTELHGIGWFLSQGHAYPVMLVMLLIGFFGGFFSVPLYTWLQTASSETFRAHAVAANNIVNGIFMVAAAILSAVLLMLFDSIALLYLIVAVGNVPLMWYLAKREPQFVRNILAVFKRSQ
ncbi:MFS transporter [Neisseria perflava]|uniref:MFS transporter n=1 Tax=Neisseria perflava TaxID=33053 RepID=UPI0020A1FFBC|nr:MFS transporter [Neisseria perflava]MCP1659891.1 MFS family permease [Neisseria perflava]MCP1773360.1 MFS family permease [Neisseria perflava]